jgi:hypothetical protein
VSYPFYYLKFVENGGIRVMIFAGFGVILIGLGICLTLWIFRKKSGKENVSENIEVTKPAALSNTFNSYGDEEI